MIAIFFKFIQGRKNIWYCGGHVVVNGHEWCITSSLALARQFGAYFMFQDKKTKKRLNEIGRLMFGRAFNKVC